MGRRYLTKKYSDTGQENRCSAVTLRSFGVEGISPAYLGGILSALEDHGMGTSQMMNWCRNRRGYKEFVESHPEGDYLLVTRGHALSIRDGVIHDAANIKLTNRTKVVYAFRVKSVEEEN
jgi:hypothetical protein